MPTSEFPGGASLSASSIGTYRVSFTVTEEDTVVHSGKNISFQVVEVPFSVKFLGGSSRWQPRTNNITLWVEVRSPSPNYTLSWSCHFLRDPQTPCFITTDPWDHFQRTVHADTPFRKLKRNYLFYRIWKMNQSGPKNSIEVEDNDHDNENPDSADSSSCEPNSSCAYEEYLEMNSSAFEDFDDDFDELSTSDNGEISDDLTSYIESLTFPCALLQPLAYELLFRVSVAQEEGTRPSSRTADQRIVLPSGPVSDVGIMRHFESYLPFGATDRVVFESICFTCTREDLDHLSYKWSLSEICGDVPASRRHRRQFESEAKGAAAAEQFVAGGENSSKSRAADHPRPKLRDRPILDAGEGLKKLPLIEVHGQSEFISRFQDYMKNYRHNSSTNFFNHTLSQLSKMVTNASTKPTSSVSASEVSRSEIQLGRHESEETQSKIKFSPLKFVDKLLEKKPRSAESSVGAPAGKSLSNEGVQKTSQPPDQSGDLHSTFEMLSSASLLHAGFLLKYEREAVEFVESLIGGTIDSVLIHEARKLFLRSRRRRIGISEKNSIWKESGSSTERVVEHIYKKKPASKTSLEIETTSPELQKSTAASIPSDSFLKGAEIERLKHVSEKKSDVKRDLETMIGVSERISPARASTNSAKMNRGLQSSSLKLVSEQTRDKRALNLSGRKLPGTTGVLQEKGRLRRTVDRLNGARAPRGEAGEDLRRTSRHRGHHHQDRTDDTRDDRHAVSRFDREREFDIIVKRRPGERSTLFVSSNPFRGSYESADEALTAKDDVGFQGGQLQRKDLNARNIEPRHAKLQLSPHYNTTDVIKYLLSGDSISDANLDVKLRKDRNKWAFSSFKSAPEKRRSLTKLGTRDSSKHSTKHSHRDSHATPILSTSQRAQSTAPLRGLSKYDSRKVQNPSLASATSGRAPLFHAEPSLKSSKGSEQKKSPQLFMEPKQLDVKNDVQESSRPGRRNSKNNLSVQPGVNVHAASEQLETYPTKELDFKDDHDAGVDFVSESTLASRAMATHGINLIDNHRGNKYHESSFHSRGIGRSQLYQEDDDEPMLKQEKRNGPYNSEPLEQSRFSSVEQQSDSDHGAPSLTRLRGPSQRSSISEKPVASLRSSQYLKQLAQFVDRHGDLPNFNCPPAYWELCSSTNPSSSPAADGNQEPSGLEGTERSQSEESYPDNSSQNQPSDYYSYEDNYAYDDFDSRNVTDHPFNFRSYTKAEQPFSDQTNSHIRELAGEPSSRPGATMPATQSNLLTPNSLKNAKTTNEVFDSGVGTTLNENQSVTNPNDDDEIDNDNVDDVDDGSGSTMEAYRNSSEMNNWDHRTSELSVNSSFSSSTRPPNGTAFSAAQFERGNPKVESTDEEEVPSEPGVATQSLMNENDEEEGEAIFGSVIDSARQEAVLMFPSMTTTGVNQPVLVLYTHFLDHQSTYILNLATVDSAAKTTGLSQYLLKFSPQPVGDGCYIRPADNSTAGRFVGTCYQYVSTYYPVIFQWSYHHTLLETKTIFYYGSLPEIEFQLPPGLEITEYEVYVTIKIYDGKGVSKTLEPKSVSVPPRHDSGDGVVAIFNEISKMESYNPGLELEQVRSLAWELNSIENSVISQTVFDNILTILFYRESCMDSLETVTEDPNDAISDNSVVESFYKVNMLKSCARDHLAEIACASVIRDEMEILQVETTLAVVLGAPEFISSKTFFRVVDAMWRMQKLHIQLWEYRTEIRSEVAKQYFSLVSTVLDKQQEIYDLSVVSVNTTNDLILSLMRVMGKEVRSRFLEESPLRYSTSTLEFAGFLTDGYGSAGDSGDWMFQLRNTSTFFTPIQTVLCLVHLKSPYMLGDSHAADVSTYVLHLRLGSSKRPTNVEVQLPRSPFLTHSEFDFRRSGTILPESLNVYELEVTSDHERLPLHIQLEVVKVYDSEYPVAPIALICKDMQSLDDPTHVMRLPASKGPNPGDVLFVRPGELRPGSYVLVIMDQNTYDNRGSRRVERHDGAIGGGAEYAVSGWWSDCLVWNVSGWYGGECQVLQSVWNIMSCSCSSPLSIYGGIVLPILNEQDTMNVNELMLMRSYCALYFVVCVLVVYVVLAVSLTTSAGLRLNRHNIWVHDNQPSHDHAYLLTIKTGTQKHAGTSAKVFAILHGTDSMSDTRELQSTATHQLFVRGSVCSFIITTEQALGNILKVQLWHNNRGDECKKLKRKLTKPPYTSSASSDSLNSTDGTSDEVSESSCGSTISSFRRSSVTSSGDCSSHDLAREPTQRSSSANSGLDFDRISIAPSSSGMSNSGDFSGDNPSDLRAGSPREECSSSKRKKFANETSNKTNSKTDDKVKGKKIKSSGSKEACCSSYPTCGNDASWFVCEVKVSELRTGAFFDFPCYQWLSVTENDTKVECEISLETPTTFWQDVEHFVPQYANENVVWTSLRSMSHSVRFYRLQRLTICLIVVLGLGAASLTTVKRINTSHTMMTPDLHLEPLLYGLLLAPLLMPIQWILEILFKASNRQEEKQASIASARKTIESLKPQMSCQNYSNAQSTGSHLSASASKQREGQARTQKPPTSDRTAESASSNLNVLSTESKEWKTMERWAENFTVENTSEYDDMFQNLLRRRTNALSSFDALLSRESRDTDPATPCGGNEQMGFAQIFGSIAGESLSESSKTSTVETHHAESVYSENSDGKNEHLNLENLLEENSVLYERGRTEGADNATWRIALQILSWAICVVCGGVCCLILLLKGSDMPVDYSSLWLQIIYSTLCTSVIVIQPLIIALYTIYRVMIYRFYQGCRGCISSCMSFPLEQSIAIWRHYRSAFGPDQDSVDPCGCCEACVGVVGNPPVPADVTRSNHSSDEGNPTEESSTSEETSLPNDPTCTAATIRSVRQMEKLARARELRFARPPPETVLLKCRLRRLKRQMITRFLAMFLRYTTFLCLLLVIMSHTFINERNNINRSLKNSILNGTCFLEKDEYYVRFSDIRSKDDWWEWATSELMGLAYNMDADYSSKQIFCDSNSVIIGNPRIRLYSVGASQCSASEYKVAKNESIISTLGINDCYLEYRDPVPHLANFLGVTDKKYEWDAHYLAVLHGHISDYSYSKHEYYLPDGEFGALLYLISLRAFGWVAEYESSRALVTEFTVYHPEYDIYSSIYYLAEFPSTSGSTVSVGVASTSLQRYKAPGAYPTMFAECLLLPIAMFLMIKSFLYLYHCGFKVWKSFWGFLDIFLTILVWSYVVCLMLRVQIAEDLMWQLKVSYFEKFVNLKGVMEWDSIISSILGFVMFIHILRCLWLFSFFPRFRRLGLILSMAMSDVLHVTGAMAILLFAFLNLGYIRLHSISDDYYSVGISFITVFSLSTGINVKEASVEDFPSGATLFFNFYRAAIALMVVLFGKAYYFAAFAFAFKSYSHNERPVEISVTNIFSFIWGEIKNIFPFRKSDETEEISDETVPPTLYVSELHGQLNEVLDKLDTACRHRGISSNRVENIADNDFSMVPSTESGDRLWDTFSRRSCQSSTLESIDANDSVITKHVDGMTDVPSFTSETRAAKNLVAGLRIFTSESVDNSFSSPRQLIYDPHSEHLTKFLLDVKSASDGNLAGSSFGKYGKHTRKMKSQENELSTPASNTGTERCSHNRNDEMCSVCTNLRKTETLGLDRNTEELDV